MTLSGPKPTWLTFDCYGTLIQWDEGLLAAVDQILSAKGRNIDQTAFISVYDRQEHVLEQERPHRIFADVSALALERAMGEFGLPFEVSDAEILTSSIGKMPPFPEVVATLEKLKAAGFRLAIISNTDDAVIAGNVAQLGGHVDRVITAQQAGAYKPSSQIFHHAWKSLGIGMEELVHICASPHLDLAAARELGFRTVWIDRGTGRKPLDDYRPNGIVSTLDKVPAILAAAGWM
ncbi:haloacid dehalogenase type II [Neorhizobium galegae]|uniref:haloacid dehalogenase type II n=1 Tax=Neorhizobium galegae TaxID=399 RepID=UPI0006221DD8|nr:haloacid dehalogenase type II [Neorhizobium galegae]CDZ29126.1 2-haloalkanoic acid dehalogenase, type II [Neorhizobium galegae bv. officinalis]KAA9383986.1 haloacid dehalogenase type II [Neorhizobium galegae]MCM2496718.1 haloacid dehalogenase type II [Neorhizobium galegae]MCQ1775646.1 haloacid dehalogenase type II [Neorhizobium galegae]MCQ1798085.1 haloacid dehalogenase type II [Neorhizobium galegae]